MASAMHDDQGDLVGDRRSRTSSPTAGPTVRTAGLRQSKRGVQPDAGPAHGRPQHDGHGDDAGGGAEPEQQQQRRVVGDLRRAWATPPARWRDLRAGWRSATTLLSTGANAGAANALAALSSAVPSAVSP